MREVTAAGITAGRQLPLRQTTNYMGWGIGLRLFDLLVGVYHNSASRAEPRLEGEGDLADRKSPVPTIVRTSFLSGNPICNFVILGLRHNPPRHHFAGFVVGTPYDHPVCFCRSHARQAQQLVFCSSVQIELLVAAPAFADPCHHSLGIAFHIRCCLRGLLL